MNNNFYNQKKDGIQYETAKSICKQTNLEDSSTDLGSLFSRQLRITKEKAF